MSIEVIPKFILKNYMNPRDWAQVDHDEDRRTLRQYTNQNENFPEDALNNRVKELLEALLKNNFEGHAKVSIDNNREKYTLVREGTSEAQFKKLILEDFQELEYDLLEDENTQFGIGYLYLDIVPGSYNANMMAGCSRRRRKNKSKKSRKSKKNKKNKKRHTKRK